MQSKQELREKLKIKRKYFQGYRREVADNVILENFISAYGGFDSFLIYNSFGYEAGTGLIVSELLKADKRVYLPRVENGGIVAVLYGETKLSPLGIYEPVGQAYDGKIDVTVAPLLAVNARGFRIGYGGGFYDGFFKNNVTLRVGLGYFFQSEEFAEDAWDEKLDTFCCERGIYHFGNTK